MCSAPAWSMASALSMVDTSQRAGISCVGRGNESVLGGMRGEYSRLADRLVGATVN
ncbi:Uncharacterised protein [Salmonella enterica subsp. arizonae]|uniref:Uncharacterized protein n=1 Tax=Salmonella enterica subsp. arizonae TaxID=59203 RepID=A0A379T8S3_SALER|nr:Uncharacterised protein [Salmonella enterica subsp. arizonae]